MCWAAGWCLVFSSLLSFVLLFFAQCFAVSEILMFIDGVSLLRLTSSLNFIHFPFSSQILQCLLPNSLTHTAYFTMTPGLPHKFSSHPIWVFPFLKSNFIQPSWCDQWFCDIINQYNTCTPFPYVLFNSSCLYLLLFHYIAAYILSLNQ